MRASALLRPLAVAALMLAAACDGPTTARPVFAYDPTTLTNGKVVRWTSGRRISVWTQVSSTETTVDLARAVRTAISSWNDLTDFAEFELVAAASIGEADIIVFDRASALPVTPGSCAFDPRNAAGYTYFCASTSTPSTAQRFALTSGSGGRASVVIRVDRTTVTSQDAYQSIVSHEFGHALGISGHSDQVRDLMFSAPTVLLPSGRDAQTLRYLLGLRPDLTL